MDKEWSWNGLTSIAPTAVASAFAFAFVVGYFSAFDITWIPFFSLSEHIVLALRALPVAIAGSVALLLALTYAEWLQGKGTWLHLLWLACLFVAAFFSLAYLHMGLFAFFLFIAVFTIVYHKAPPPPKSTANVLYWASNLLALTLMIGFCSGYAWKIEKLAHLPYSSQMDIELREPEGKHVFGHLIAAGNTAVLAYDFDEKDVRLLERRNIRSIAEQPRQIISAERWPEWHESKR
jgi:hypothetical protein